MRTLPETPTSRTHQPLAGRGYSVQDLRDLILGFTDERAQWQAREAAAFAAGRASVLGSYDEGWTLGNDTGLGARQDTRSYVHGILEGFRDGCQSRRNLTDQLLGLPRRYQRPAVTTAGELLGRAR